MFLNPARLNICFNYMTSELLVGELFAIILNKKDSRHLINAWFLINALQL